MSDTNENTGLSPVELQRILYHLIQKTTRKLEKQKEELDESQKHLWYKQIGDSLLAISTKQNQKGQSRITLLNVYTQTVETVAINPKLDFKGNAELLFKKAKKGKRGSEISIKKVEMTQHDIDELTSLKKACEKSIEKKEQMPADLIEKCTVAVTKHDQTIITQNESGKASQQTAKVPYRHYLLNGWDIYIGKTDTQNDELSIHFAKPSDIWLHVAGHAGSHVVIRRPKNAEMPPREVIEKSAAMAVWFSKAKHTSFAEVHYTEARYVRKRRHAPPGEVQIDQYKSVRVSPKSPQDIFPSTFLKDDDL